MGSPFGNEHLHGTPGRPSYRKYHPSGRNKKSRGVSRHEKGGWLGSDRFDETEHEMVLDFYTSTSYRPINRMLRHGEDPGSDKRKARLQHEVSVLTDFISIQDPTTSETTLYRGTREPISLGVGDEFHDRGFVSTSRDESVSTRFSSSEGVLFKIAAPKGSQMLDVASVGGPDDEQEVLLPPGTQYRVTKVGTVEGSLMGGAPYYEVEIING